MFFGMKPFTTNRLHVVRFPFLGGKLCIFWIEDELMPNFVDNYFCFPELEIYCRVSPVNYVLYRWFSTFGSWRSTFKGKTKIDDHVDL